MCEAYTYMQAAAVYPRGGVSPCVRKRQHPSDTKRFRPVFYCTNRG
jgi:hypothetical protein